MWLGVACGIIAAFLQSLSYIFSRHILQSLKTTPLHLLLVSHIWMGIACGIALPFVWMQPESGYAVFFPYLGLQLFFYTCAQFAFFWTIRHAAASRVSPMMGIKIVFAAIYAFTIRDEDLSVLQLIAIGLTLLAAFAVSRSGEPMPWKALLGTLVVVICFATSDLGITLCADAIQPDASLRDMSEPIFICVLSYTVVGFLCLCGLPVVHMKLRDSGSVWPWSSSLMYSLTWLGAMIFLFSAFALIGLVFGAIAQSLRGPLSVLLAVAIAKLGWDHIEQQRSRSDFTKQLLSAFLMVVAISIYCLSKVQ